MEIFFGVVIVLAYLVLTSWAALKAAEQSSLFGPYGGLAFLLAAVGLSVFVYAASVEEEKGPCLHYETEMYWNASVKAMMPARVCTLRAEWVEQ